MNTALQLQVQARRDALAPTQQQLTGFLIAHGIGGRTLYACELVLEEILPNRQNELVRREYRPLNPTAH